MIYFDNAATTPVDPAVIDVIHEVLQKDWGNPSSLHRKGYQAEKRLSAARESIAGILGTDAKSIYFTGSATDANNIAIRGSLKSGTGQNIVISAIEHSSILNLAAQLEREGWEIRKIPVDSYGRVRWSEVDKLVDDYTALVAVMHVNNELGTIEPVAEIGQKLKEDHPEVRFLVDGTQALGKLSVRLSTLPIDFYTASGHKIMAPKGVGLLYVHPDAVLRPLEYGGGQERGLHPGTENVAYACGMAKALELMMQARTSEQYDPNITEIHRRARARIARMQGVRLNSPEDASPYILNIAIEGIRAEVLMHFMEMEEMYLSSGSACSKGRASHVLEAIGIPDRLREGCVRVSFQRENRADEVDPFFDRMEEGIRMMRELQR